ncbi:MAG TPA: hypothetical protein VIO61_17130 [Anaerolineaceae bacterium]
MIKFIRLHSAEWSFLAILGWTAVIAFGVMIPWLGLYADDLPFLYVNKAAGFMGVVNFISWVRPFGAYVFAFFTMVMGENFWLIHILLLLMRLGCSVLLWRVLIRLFPMMPGASLGAALLLCIYPAFKQQPLALEYTPHFLALGMFLSSILLIEHNLNQSKTAWWMQVLPVILSTHIFLIEYFVGLELLRPLIIFWILYQREKQPRRLTAAALINILPYLTILGLFFLWRVAIFKFPSYQPTLLSDLANQPLPTLMLLIKTILKDLYTTSIGAWIQAFHLPASRRLLIMSAGILVVTLAPLIIFFQRLTVNVKTTSRLQALAMMILGGVALLTAGVPFWVTGLPVQLDFPWDRTTLAFMPGACIWLAALLAFLPWRATAITLSILTAFSCSLHFQNANQYRREWELIRSFYWQLSWRVPGLETGTGIVLDQTPFAFHVDTFLTPTLVLTYAAPPLSLNLPYRILDFYKLEGKSIPPKSADQSIETRYGTLTFKSSINHLVMVEYPPVGCLRVLYPGDSVQTQGGFEDSLVYSNPALIRVGVNPPAQPPAFLGAEPERDWCYYFQKIDLARQQLDWQTAANLVKTTQEKNLLPSRPIELRIAVESLARTGDLAGAAKLSKVFPDNKEWQNQACQLWKELEKELSTSENEMQVVRSLQREYQCSP